MRRWIALLALGLAAGSAAAQPVVVREQYWQTLPNVIRVSIDSVGNPWFTVRDGDLAASYKGPVRTVAPVQTVLLIDPAGRVWVNESYSKRTETRFFDGKQ